MIEMYRTPSNKALSFSLEKTSSISPCGVIIGLPAEVAFFFWHSVVFWTNRNVLGPPRGSSGLLSPMELKMRLDSNGRSNATEIFNKPTRPPAGRFSRRTARAPPERSCLAKQKGQHTAIFAIANVLHRGVGIAEEARRAPIAQGVMIQGRKR